uniref:Alpha-1,3-glucosyltransferase n=1 Tax=Parastrongyloides trichosuri TaxID=131310 RepID=A0A0N4Z1Y7_PARTI
MREKVEKKDVINNKNDFLKITLITVTCLVAIKSLMIRSYTSTDFEVHRNWMAITLNKKLSEWYYEKTSEWTMDYPPFFAYFEWILSRIGCKIGIKDSLVISKEGIKNDGILYYQRITVIVGDFLYYYGAYLITKIAKESPFVGGEVFTLKKKFLIFFNLVSFVPLILLDNIHFQYNAFLTGLVLLSINYVLNDNILKAAIISSVLINFKHIYLYYAPGYVAFYLFNYLLPLETNIISRILLLGLSVGIPIILSFGPFLYAGGIEGINQILSRLFPFQRGLTHAFWAPNFWALYNTIDLLLYHVRRIHHKIYKIEVEIMKPQYTNGLVQEYEHTTLPNIMPIYTITMILIFLTPLIKLNITKMDRKEKYLKSLIISSMAFFCFGYHVHEKAILLPLIPLMLLSFKNLKYLSLYFNIYILSHFTIFPLIFSPLENILKYILSIGVSITISIFYETTYGIKLWRNLNQSSKIFFLASISLEVVNKLLLPKIFPSLIFLPNLLTSTLHGVIFIWTYFTFIYVIIKEDGNIERQKNNLLKEESKLKSFLSTTMIKDVKNIKIVAGVDGTYNKEGNGQICVIGIQFYDFKNMKEIKYFEEIVINTRPYIPSYFSIKEGNCVVKYIKDIINVYPNMKPDVILIDGNGIYHKRNFGLASYISCKLGIPGIGITKNIDLNPLNNVYDKKKIVNELSILDNNINIFPYDKRCLILRINNSKKFLFISNGNGMQTMVAGEIVEKIIKNVGIQSLPINVCDKRTRDTYRKYFEK